MTRKRAAQSPEYAVSDEAAAYIADALMEIALQFEASHFAQIRRHYETITPERDDDRWQLDLFREHQPFRTLGPFFGSTRAASILPSRPPNLAAVARRACQGWPRLRGHPKGLALTGPSTAARSSGSGWSPPQSPPGRRTLVILAPAGRTPTPANPRQHTCIRNAGAASP